MINLHKEIIYGATGQTVEFTAPDGRPSSATSATLIPFDADDDGGTAQALASVTIGSVSTTVSSTSGDGQSDPTLITVASATGIKVGGTYLLTSTTGATEWIVVAAKNSTAIYARSPLRNSYASSSTFQDTTISAAFPDAEAGNANKITSPTRRIGYRVRWVYVGADGTSKTAQTTVAIVRYQTRNPVLPVHVDNRFPGWLERLPTDYRADQGKSLIDSAFESVRVDILQEGQIDHAQRDPSALAELVIHKTMEIALEVALQVGAATAQSLVAAREGYMERLNRLIRQPIADMQTSEGGASSTGVRVPFWKR